VRRHRPVRARLNWDMPSARPMGQGTRPKPPRRCRPWIRRARPTPNPGGVRPRQLASQRVLNKPGLFMKATCEITSSPMAVGETRFSTHFSKTNGREFDLWMRRPSLNCRPRLRSLTDDGQRWRPTALTSGWEQPNPNPY
jgi:hypothetical protein